MSCHPYDISAIDQALDDLGMLSTITSSRKEYIQEKDNFVRQLQNLNMNTDGAGPSGISDKDSKGSFLTSLKKRLCESTQSNESFKVSFVDCKEKENKLFSSGIRILTMNSQFITGFKAGYELPCHGSRQNSGSRIFKCLKRRKMRVYAHPYASSNVHSTSLDEYAHRDLLDDDQSASRLRTTSLSSGSGNRRKVMLERQKSLEMNSGLQRSRSMEDLMAIGGNCLLSEKTKDLETVSKGIQELHMEDCT